MSPEQFRQLGYAVIDRIAAYLAEPERWPVLPATTPGSIRSALPAEPPETAESMTQVLADFDRLIVPNTTHWNHPGFMAYFSNSGSPPGILGEALTAALNVNAMLWRTGPAATELEETTVAWLRQLMGLPPAFDGTINDTASVSTLHALAAAREFRSELRVREDGLAGRPELPRLRVYCSDEAHSSVDKAVVTLGLGLSGVRRIRTDERFAIDVAALEHALEEDRRAGILPLAVVATVGTTSTTAVDPVAALASVCDREGIWLHVDAAYAGAAGLLPEMRWVMEGCERADSLVVNPHKWLLVPVDCSVLYTRRPDVLRRAFSLVPEYLATPETDARNLMDYGVALGRRFRALKLWFVLRHYGAEGLRAILREHIKLAHALATEIDAEPDWQRLAPADFSVVVFRYSPPGVTDEEAIDRLNMQILQQVNASGAVFLSHTKVRDRIALRVAIGNFQTTGRHVQRAWELLRDAAKTVL